ncbi:MAG TPA: sigma-70 family RNA polymerase sigma factor [Streptosporangiaceae bacterium]
MTQTVPMDRDTDHRAAQARPGFAERTDPFRRELLAHCYRMLGSVHDAEDLVQETMLRAWRSSADFDEERASLRTWLYRIATNACLNALDSRSRRPLPSDLSDPRGLAEAARLPAWQEPEIAWLEPFPDALLGTGAGGAADPATVVADRDSIRLAFVAALQHLPARQRAVLILRDVLAWRAAEVARLLGITPIAVNSALQRARARLEQASPGPDRMGTAPTARQQELADRYVTAFVDADVTTLTQLLADEVVLEMPPYPQWFRGRETVARFLFHRGAEAGRWRAIPVSANGQPAAGLYRIEADGRHHARMIQVFHASEAGLTWLPSFHDPALFPLFGLPLICPGAPQLPGRQRTPSRSPDSTAGPAE